MGHGMYALNPNRINALRGWLHVEYVRINKRQIKLQKGRTYNPFSLYVFWGEVELLLIPSLGYNKELFHELRFFCIWVLWANCSVLPGVWKLKHLCLLRIRVEAAGLCQFAKVSTIAQQINLLDFLVHMSPVQSLSVTYIDEVIQLPKVILWKFKFGQSRMKNISYLCHWSPAKRDSEPQPDLSWFFFGSCLYITHTQQIWTLCVYLL